MAGLLDFLGRAATAGVGAESARLEGQMLGQDREQKNLLVRLKQEQDAAEQRRRAQMDDLTRRNIESQIAERERPPEAAPVRPQYVDSRGGFVSPEGFTPVPGLSSAPAEQYEEREEGGGVAIYKNGQFQKWKLAPASERSISTGEALAQNRTFQREQGLADDFRQEQDIKDAKGIAGAVTTIRGALNNPTPQGDLAAIYALVKLYDPGSVVREGEISLTQSAASLPEQARRLLEGWNSGKKLTPQMRADLASVADSIVAQRQLQINPTLARYGERARRWGADSAAVAPNPFEGTMSGADVMSKYGLERTP